MQYFVKNFDPHEYEGLIDLSGNENITLMCHTKTKKLIVRKTISGINMQLYKQLVNIRHKNLVKVMGMKETEFNCYTYEEYINGETLSEILANGPVMEDKAVQWIGQLCEAVSLLHEQSPIIIHRDIKPGNIILSSDDVIKLIDFDASKEFTPHKQRDTELIGTPNYAAPEQYGFASSDPRTDVYAIGILFHELITGYKPNEIKSPYQGRYKKIIQNCIELDPNRRYQNIQELEQQIGMHKVPGIIGHIPGFRTGVWWKKEVALGAYIIMAILMGISFFSQWNLHENMVKSLVVLGCWIILCLPPYLLITNFLRVWEKLPLLRSRIIMVKVFGVILYLLLGLWLFSIATSIEKNL